MSRRLVIPDRTEAERELRVARPWWQFTLHFNVSVAQRVPVARIHESESEGVMMVWGLVGPAAKGDIGKIGSSLAKSADLGAAEEFRSAWIHGQRGIVPVAGFFVWQRTPAGKQQPFYVRLVNRTVFGVAALWERSESDEGDVLESCAIVTVPSNPLLAEIDNGSDQMPAILRRDDYAKWLSGNVTEASALLESYPAVEMLTHPVRPHVDDPNIDNPILIRPAPQSK